MLIDTHCHLTDEKFENVDRVVTEARANGIEKIIIPSTSLQDARKAAEIAGKEKLYSLAGIHPEEIEKINDVDSEIAELQKLLNLNQVVGVGEIGLDFYWDKEKKTAKKQEEIFSKQMSLAAKTGYPAAIHMREAEKEMTEILRTMTRLPSGQFHCFAGSPDFLRLVLKMGFYVSFCGNITYKSAGNLRELLKQVPLDRLLLETDSPYLAPEPLRGTVNQPANVKIIAKFMASELDITLENLAEITSKNALCLYSLES